jgi:hypothetical protein
MKSFKTFPTTEGQPFFERYATLIHSLTKFGVIAQIITGMAEIGIIYSLLYPSFSDLFPTIAHPLSITGALLCASLLQTALKALFPYSVRAILFKRFTGLDLPLSIFIFLLTGALLTVSILLSYKGSQDIIDVAIAPPTEKNTNAPDSIKAATEQRAATMFTTDSATIETKYKGKIEATISNYDNQIFNVEKWSKGKKATSLRAEKVSKLATLQSEKAAEIESRSNERKATIAHATDRNDSERTDIKAANGEARTLSDNRKSKYKNYVGYFCLFLYLFFLIGFVLDEIYKKGAGIEETVLPHQRHFAPSLFAEWLEAIKARYDTFIRSKIYAFADKTNASPLPVALHGLYDFKATALKNVHTIEVEEMDDDDTRVIKLPNKPLRIAAKKKDDTKKTDDTATRKIGFFGKNSGGLNDTEKLSTDDSTKIVGGRNTTEFEPNTITIVGGTETMGQCPNCLKSFVKNHKKHTYCSDVCRGEFWQRKTNKPLHKNKTGKN